MGVVPDVVALAGFAVVGVLLIRSGNRRVRRIARAWPPRHRDRFDPATLSGEQLGYLSGRAAGAIEAAVARLRIGGAITYRWSSSSFVATGRRLPVEERTALSTAVLSAVSKQIPIGELDRYPKVAAALRGLRERLDDTGKEPDVPRLHFASAGAPVLMLSLAALAWALVPPFRWPTGLLLILLAIAGLIAGAVVGSRPTSLETVRLRTVRRARERNPHLDPGMNPTLATYGPAAAAVAVGLFGLSALASTDLPLSSVSIGAQLDEAAKAAEAARAAAAAEHDDDDRLIYGCGGFDGATSGGGGAGCGVCGVT